MTSVHVAQTVKIPCGFECLTAISRCLQWMLGKILVQKTDHQPERGTTRNKPGLESKPLQRTSASLLADVLQKRPLLKEVNALERKTCCQFAEEKKIQSATLFLDSNVWHRWLITLQLLHPTMPQAQHCLTSKRTPGLPHLWSSYTHS